MSHYLLFTLFTGTVLVISIPITNPSFESDDYPLPTDTLRYGPHIISNWDNYDPSSTLFNDSIGIANPFGGTSINDPLYGTGVPNGIQCAYIFSRTSAELGIYQILSGITIAAQTTYTLSVNIANALYPNSYYVGYRVQILVAHKNVILAEDDNTLTIAVATWKESTVVLRILSQNEFIGEPLAIRLINKGNAMIYFDNVRLQINTTSTSTGSDEKSEQKLSMLDWMFILLGILVAVSCCVCVLLIAIFIRRRSTKMDEDEDVININLKQSVVNMPMIGVGLNYNTTFASGVVAKNGYVGSEDQEEKEDKKEKKEKRDVEAEDQRVIDAIKVTVKDEYDTPQKPMNPDDDPALIAGLEETIE